MEWALLGAVILVLILVLVRQQRRVQGQAELAAIRSTLGALRVAFVLDQLRANTTQPQAAVVTGQRNPFHLLQSAPVNYRGEMNASKVANLQPGSWLYDPECGCIGYRPIDPQWLSGASDAASVWYRVSGGTGVLQLVAMDAYRWQGEALN